MESCYQSTKEIVQLMLRKINCETSVSLMNTASLRRTPSYLTWFASDTAIGLTRALAGFALPLIALTVTDDPARAGIIGGIGMAVSAITMLGGGVYADRHSRTCLLLMGSVVGAVVAGGFLVLALSDALTFAALLAVEVLLALRGGFFGMAGEALLKDIVPSEVMGRAQGANQGRDAVMNLAGGPLGGALLGVGAWLIGVALLACQAVAVATALILRRRVPDPVRAPREKTGVLAEARSGIVWLFRRADLRGAVIVITIINLGIGASMTTVIYSLQQRGFGPADIGWLSAGIGISMLLGALVSAPIVARVATGVLAIVGIGVLAGCVAAVPFVENLWGLIALMGAGSFLIPALNAGMMGYFMVAVPSEMTGRAMSAAGLGTSAVAPLAPLIAGFGLSLFGRTPTLIVAAVICLSAAALAIATPSLRAIPAEAGWVDHAARFAREVDADASGSSRVQRCEGS
jgi:MFS family permease